MVENVHIQQTVTLTKAMVFSVAVDESVGWTLPISHVYSQMTTDHSEACLQLKVSAYRPDIAT